MSTMLFFLFIEQSVKYNVSLFMSSKNSVIVTAILLSIVLSNQAVEDCTEYIYQGRCLKNCPARTSINSDISFNQCASDKSCLRHGGLLYKDENQKHCNIFKMNQTFPGFIQRYKYKERPKCGETLDTNKDFFIAPSYLWFKNFYPYGESLCDRKYCVRFEYLRKSHILPIKDDCSKCTKDHMSLSAAAMIKYFGVGNKIERVDFTFVPYQYCDKHSNSIKQYGQERETLLRQCGDNEICMQIKDCVAICEKIDKVECDNKRSLKFDDECVTECPANTILMLDLSNDTCVTEWECNKRRGNIVTLDFIRYCKMDTPKWSTWQIVIVILVVSMIFLMFLIIVVIYIWKIKKNYVPRDIDLRSENYDALSATPGVSGLTIISKKFIRNLGQKLGEGAFGIVYKGELTLDEDNKNQSQKYYIAIKEIKGYFLYGVDNSQNSSLNEIIMEKIEEMMEEAKIMSKINHPNVLPLYGICIADHTVKIITPYRRLGSLDQFLINNSEKISGKLQIQFCHQIAAAMSYLSDKQIVHGDLATRNVLIACDTVSAKKENSEFSNLAAQVSDFGLAQIIDKNLTKNNDILPFRWAAIECLKGYKTRSYIFNQKTDVWSFGVTIWEIFSYGRTPYDELFEKHVKSTTETTYSLFSDELNRIINSGGSTRKSSLNDMIKVLLDFLLNGERLPRPLICKDEIYLIMLECWRESPEQRRPFEYFETIFKEASKNPNDYVAKIDPRLLSDHNTKNRSLNLGLDPVTYYLSNKMPEHNPLLNQQQITEQDSGISADRHRSKNDDSNIEQ